MPLMLPRQTRDGQAGAGGIAAMIGVSVGTLRNWEQGRRIPEGPARALLQVASCDPEAVRKALMA